MLWSQNFTTFLKDWYCCTSQRNRAGCVLVLIHSVREWDAYHSLSRYNTESSYLVQISILFRVIIWMKLTVTPHHFVPSIVGIARIWIVLCQVRCWPWFCWSWLMCPSRSPQPIVIRTVFWPKFYTYRNPPHLLRLGLNQKSLNRGAEQRNGSLSIWWWIWTFTDLRLVIFQACWLTWKIMLWSSSSSTRHWLHKPVWKFIQLHWLSVSIDSLLPMHIFFGLQLVPVLYKCGRRQMQWNGSYSLLYSDRRKSSWGC